MATLVFPTRVGMNRSAKIFQPISAGVPHASGDEPRFVPVSTEPLECSPREWG